MSTDVDQYDKSHRLSQDQKEEVQQALRKYKRTSYGFGVLGMGYGAYRAYTRKAPTGRLLISVGIGYFVGSFVGTIIGFAAAANYIKKSPYRDAIMQAMRESKEKPQGPFSGPGATQHPPSFPGPEGQPAAVPGESTMSSDYESSPHRDNEAHVDRGASSSNATSSPNRWAEIRRQSTNSNSAWDRVRQKTISNSPNPYDHVDSVRSSSSSSSANTRYDAGPSDGDWSQSSLPRTREAMEARAHSGNVRTNQYGDIMDD